VRAHATTRAGLTLGLGLVLGSCSLGELNLAGLKCPCVRGYVCDVSSNTCVANTEGDGDGSAGDAPSDAISGGADGTVPAHDGAPDGDLAEDTRAPDDSSNDGPSSSTTYVLDLTHSNEGPAIGLFTVESSPMGIDCKWGSLVDAASTSCSAPFPAGATVTLTFTSSGPHFSYKAESWTGCSATGTNVCSVVMSGTKAISVTVEEMP
jgi:hypothetical protein